MGIVLLLLSCLVLTLEVLETKIFAYSLENSLIFLVVGVVLLGFGAGGSVLACRRDLTSSRSLVGACLLATAVLLVDAHWWFAQFSDHLQFEFDLWTVSMLVLLAAPYFTAGMAVSAILAEPKGNVHLRYGLNLIGSGIGCLTVFFVLGPLTAPQCLVGCAIACGLLAVTVVRRRIVVAAAVLGLGVPLFVHADDLLPYRIQKAEVAGQLALIKMEAAKVVATNPAVQRLDVVSEFDRWDPTARVEVHSLDTEITDPALAQAVSDAPSMWFTQDSSYGSPLVGDTPGAVGVFERSCYAFGYFRGRADMDVLVIGLGGTPDLQTALRQNARRIVAVDINSTAVEMGRGPLADFLGRPYDDPRIEVHLRDGRSFVRSSDERFDLIQLSGVDTKSVLASGTLALNESYLYTAQAFDEYLARLNDDGLLVINYSGDALRHRFAVTAMAALARRGVADPTRCVMMLEQSKIFGILVKPTPFTDAECTQMQEWLRAADLGDGKDDDLTGVTVWTYELLSPHLSLLNAPRVLYLPDETEPTDPVIRAARAGTLDAWLTAQPIQLTPAPDDCPYFFNIVRARDILARFEFELQRLAPWINADVQAFGADRLALTEPFARSFRLLCLMLGLSLVLILGPLVVLGARGLRAWAALPYSLYFAALGAGYILAMSGLIQRYVLFLGHQAYAFATVIGGLLLASGFGSMLAGRFEHRPRTVMTVAVVTIAIALAAIQFALDGLFATTAGLSLPLRVTVALLAIAPLGVPLGTLFPTGLGLVRQRSPNFVPWAFGINGVFSVIGTSVVLPGAIMFGQTQMSIVAAAVYVFALLVGLPLARRGS